MPFVRQRNPIVDAVNHIITGSYLNASGLQYYPNTQVYELDENTNLPAVTAEAVLTRVQPDYRNAEVDFIIQIWDRYPDQVDTCETRLDLDLFAASVANEYTMHLVEILMWMTGEITHPTTGKPLFPLADYTLVGPLTISYDYRRENFSTLEDFKNSPLKDQLIGASITGTLSGMLEYICCTDNHVFDPEVYVYDNC